MGRANYKKYAPVQACSGPLSRKLWGYANGSQSLSFQANLRGTNAYDSDNDCRQNASYEQDESCRGEPFFRKTCPNPFGSAARGILLASSVFIALALQRNDRISKIFQPLGQPVAYYLKGCTLFLCDRAVPEGA